jgi:hypothetical protein
MAVMSAFEVMCNSCQKLYQFLSLLKNDIINDIISKARSIIYIIYANHDSDAQNT